MHYSFEHAQQVHFPSDPLQPGPIHFLTPRKCGVFGFNCEALPRQVNFLSDEAGDSGKGSNTVVSELHYFFENHGFGKKEVYLHAATVLVKIRTAVWYSTLPGVHSQTQQNHPLISRGWSHKISPRLGF